MKKVLKLALLLLMSCCSHLSFGQTFNRTYDIGNYICNAGTVVPCADGTFVTFAAIYSVQQGGLIFYKINSNGDTLFTKRYWFPQRVILGAGNRSAHELSNGDIIYCGGIADSGDVNRDFHLVHFNSSGDTVRTLELGTIQNDKANSLFVQGDTLVVAVGYSLEANQASTDIAVAVYNIATGIYNFDNIPYNGVQSAIAVDRFSNNQAIIGAKHGPDFFVLRYDWLSEQVIWDTILPLTNSFAYVTVALPNKILVAGLIDETSGGYDSKLYCLDSTGSVLWSRVYGNSSDDEFVTNNPIYDVTSGRIYLTGVHSNAMGSDAAMVITCDTLGFSIYSSIIPSPNVSGGVIYDSRALPSGFILAGFNYANNGDVWLVRTDTAGCLVPGCFTTVPVFPDDSLLQLSIFPNPATQAITVQLQVEERTTGTLEVYGLSGQLVLKQQVVFENNGSGVVVNIAELPNGLYSVVVRTGLGVPYVKRFVKAE